MGFAEAMLIEYNKRARGTALRFDLLHTHRAPKHQFPSENTSSTATTDEATAPETENQQLDLFHASVELKNAPE